MSPTIIDLDTPDAFEESLNFSGNRAALRQHHLHVGDVRKEIVKLNIRRTERSLMRPSKKSKSIKFRVHMIHPWNLELVACGGNIICGESRYRNNTTDIEKVTCGVCLKFMDDIKSGRKNVRVPYMHFLNSQKNNRTICGHNTAYGRFRKNTNNVNEVTCPVCLNKITLHSIK